MKPFVEPQMIRLRLSALHLTSSALFRVEPLAEAEPLQIRFVGNISMPDSSILNLDSTIWRLTGHNADQIKFFVDKAPEGSIIMQINPKDKSGISLNGHVSMFTIKQLQSGNLRYLHHGSNQSSDWFSVNFTTSEREVYGPFRFDIKMVESVQVNMEIKTMSLN
jgi:hypothetical protein